jgi:hypothetical protein
MNSKLLAICLLLFFFCSGYAQKQGKKKGGGENPDAILELSGIAVYNNAEIENISVAIYKDGVKENEFVSSKKDKLFFSLVKNASYSITFNKEGYIQRLISINTEVPVNLKSDEPYGFDFEVEMIPVDNNFNAYYLDFPVASIGFNPDKMVFENDAKYSEGIKSHY